MIFTEVNRSLRILQFLLRVISAIVESRHCIVFFTESECLQSIAMPNLEINCSEFFKNR